MILKKRKRKILQAKNYKFSDSRPNRLKIADLSHPPGKVKKQEEMKNRREKKQYIYMHDNG